MKNIRGAFLVNGEWIPNQFTTKGLKSLLAFAFQGTPANWLLGLCNVNPADDISYVTINEPSFGFNGYGWQNINLNNIVNWPTISDINGEVYVESKLVTFTATGPYDKVSNRLYIKQSTLLNEVMAVSSAFPGGPMIISSDFQTKYRLYFR